MKTNKPATYWAPRTALAKLESRHNNAPCILTDGPAEFNDVALVRLDDYEALQAELARELHRRFDGNEQASREHREDAKALVEALEWIAGADCDPGEGATDFAVAMGRGIAIGNIHRKAAEALAAHRKQEPSHDNQ